MVTESNLTFIEARADAVRTEMRRDPKVIMWGTDMRAGLIGLGGPDFVDEFGPERVFDSPLSENAEVGIALGASLMGYRPIVDLCRATFAHLAQDQLVNQVSTARYRSGGQLSSPMVVSVGMAEPSSGPQGAARTYPLFMNTPGLKIACPTTPRNAKGLWATAIRDEDPVLIYELLSLSVRRQAVPDGEFLIPFGQAEVVRAGSDVTLVSVFRLGESIAAAEAVSREGISVEVIDPRTLVPFDLDTILASVEKTGRLVIADMAHDSNSAASHISALVAQHGFSYLREPILRVCTPDVHIPSSPALERRLYPTKERIAAALRTLVGAKVS
jgi:acetoin:2,6-dichlorophenolindophenol oxidoreductase subunit beta